MDRFETQDSFNGSPAIIAKIDALTIVYNNCTFVEALDSIGLSEILTPDYVELFNSRFLTSFGYGADIKMSWNGVGIAAHCSDMLNVFNVSSIDLLEIEDPHMVMNTRLPYIKIDMMGQALDYLRSIDIDIDTMIFNPLIIPEGAAYHFTRVDFAYDLLNYMGNFVDLCKAACELYHNDNRLIHVTGTKTGMSYSTRSGDQNTLYIGKGGSNRMLRIYDKKLQYERSGKFVNDCPYYGTDDITGEKILPSTWVRIELQCRRAETCHMLCYSENSSFLTVFRHIYEKFAIKEGQGLHVPVCGFWNDLFDWSVIPTIIQNAKCVKVDVDPLNNAIRYFENTALGSVVLMMASAGPDAFLFYINNLLRLMQQSDSGLRRWHRIKQKILESNSSQIPAFLSKGTNGIYQLTRSKVDDQAIYRYLMGGRE